MTSIADQLRAIADQLDGKVVEDFPQKPGLVAVRPTGPLGQGVTRWYPDPNSIGLPEGCNLLGYASVISGMINEDGQPYQNPNTLGLYFMAGDTINRLAAQGWAKFPEAVDRMAHPQDWFTQEELDYYARLAERDRKTGVSFSPR